MNTFRCLLPSLIIAAASAILAAPGAAQDRNPAPTAKDIAALRAEITAMQADITEIKENVITIRKAFDMARERASAVQKISVRLDASSTNDFTLGRPDAPITIMEFYDYQCGFCAKFHKTTFKDIKRRLIDTGKVRFVYRDYTLTMHAMAAQASAIASCAQEQGKFLEMHEVLFSEPELLGQAKFQDLVEKVPGIDLIKLEQCVQRPEHRVEIGAEGPIPSPEIQADMEEGERMGVVGTPAFVIGKTVAPGQEFNAIFIRGDQEYSVFENAIAQLEK